MKKKLASIFCALFRHSHLVTNFIGYKYCARCGAQLGDTLAGTGLSVGKGGHFLIGQTCQCDACRASFDSLTWLDRFMCDKPVWPTDEYVASEKKKKREFLETLMASRADRERVRI
jgi:hypothetical protein